MYDLLKALSCQRWSLPRMSHTQPWQNPRLRLVAKVSSQDTGSKHHVTAAVHTATARPTPAAYVPINSVIMQLNNVLEMIIQISV